MTDDVRMTKEVEDHEKLQRSILFIKSVALLLSILIALLGATIAWFTLSHTATATGFSVKTQLPEGGDYSVGGYDATAPITLPCAARLQDMVASNANPLQGSNVTAAELAKVQEVVFIANYTLTKNNSSASNNVNLKLTIPSGCDYLKIMYLGSNNSTLSANDVAAFVNRIKGQTVSGDYVFNSGSSGGENSISINRTFDSDEINAYFAFYADYNASYTYENSSHQSVTTTLGQALKDGVIDPQTALTVQLGVQAGAASS